MRLLVLLLCFGAPLSAQVLRLEKGGSRVLTLPGLKRVAVADGKIARAKAIPPNELLLLGKAIGQTVLHVWVKGEESQRVYRLNVVDSSWEGAGEKPDLVRALLEFFEMDEKHNEELGIRWPNAIEWGTRGTGWAGAAASGLNYAFQFDSAPGWIRQGVEEGWAKRIARPELYVRLGETATFHSGGEFPVMTSQGGNGYLQRRVDWKKYGLTVKLSPQSIDGLNIRSHVVIEMSEPGTEKGDVPSVNRRTLDTKITAREGESLVLSGLNRQAKMENSHRVSILSEIPVVGRLLFQQKGSESHSSELVMAMTFDLMEPGQEAERVQETREHFQ